MHSMYRTVALLVLGLGAGGCDKADTRTPAEKFRDSQKDTVTPHGKINPDSVKDNGGKIDYDTTDGSKWTVDPPSVRADGTSEYQPPAGRK